jgi:hypothetical protein
VSERRTIRVEIQIPTPGQIPGFERIATAMAANPRIAEQARGLVRHRTWALAIAGLAVAANGQRVINESAQFAVGMRLYIVGALLLILAWMGTEPNLYLRFGPRTLTAYTFAPRFFGPISIRLPRGHFLDAVRSAIAYVYGTDEDEPQAKPLVQYREWTASAPSSETWSVRPPVVVATAALVLNLISTWSLRGVDYGSLFWGVLWVLSLVLVVVAGLMDRGTGTLRPRPAMPTWRVPQLNSQNVVSFLGRYGPIILICIVALYLRVYRAGDWTGGMHGDEGEYGSDVMRFLSGDVVTPFKSSMFGLPLMNQWLHAVFVLIFGHGLLQLRLFDAITGVLIVASTYALCVEWFNRRVALIAAIFIAMSTWATHMSRQALGLNADPLAITVGLYFLTTGIKRSSPVRLALAGFALFFGAYFYFAGRGVFILLPLFLLYLFVISPIIASLSRRAAEGRVSRTGLLAADFRSIFSNLDQLYLLVVMSFCVVSPLVIQFLDNSAVGLGGRVGSVLVLGNPDAIPPWYAITHEPLYFSLRWPQLNDVFSLIPFGFEPGAISIRLAEDGFWPRALLKQLTVTLAAFTHRLDLSSFFLFPRPLVHPIEAVFILVGAAWALSRWRDYRMALLSIWFWVSIILFGVLTERAPNVLRIVGVIPVVAIFAGLVVDKLLKEMANAFEGQLTVSRWVERGLTSVVIAAIVFVGAQRAIQYQNEYINVWPYAGAVALASFARSFIDEYPGQPRPYFYDFGLPNQNWVNPVNRFLNWGTQGTEVEDLTRDLANFPDDRPVVFMFWTGHDDKVGQIQARHPGGEEGVRQFGPEALNLKIRYYRLPASGG